MWTVEQTPRGFNGPSSGGGPSDATCSETLCEDDLGMPVALPALLEAGQKISSAESQRKQSGSSLAASGKSDRGHSREALDFLAGSGYDDVPPDCLRCRKSAGSWRCKRLRWLNYALCWVHSSAAAKSRGDGMSSRLLAKAPGPSKNPELQLKRRAKDSPHAEWSGGAACKQTGTGRDRIDQLVDPLLERCEQLHSTNRLPPHADCKSAC